MKNSVHRSPAEVVAQNVLLNEGQLKAHNPVQAASHIITTATITTTTTTATITAATATTVAAAITTTVAAFTTTIVVAVVVVHLHTAKLKQLLMFSVTHCQY